jgi:transposase
VIRHAISDADWERLAPLLPGRPGTPGRSGDDNRRFLHAVNWVARTGAPWRDLPAELGNWNTAWRRFDRWSRAGVWERIAEHVQDPDLDWVALDWVALDSTTVRAHQHAAGAQKRGPRRKTPPPARGSAVAGAG